MKGGLGGAVDGGLHDGRGPGLSTGQGLRDRPFGAIPAEHVDRAHAEGDRRTEQGPGPPRAGAHKGPPGEPEPAGMLAAR